ncbi:hypothetical protein [Hyphomonas sp.]|uniref:hypothetical protein n=1 Tax=Hyphomonas sp. TaxID=87 RepID=UPI00391B5620
MKHFLPVAIALLSAAACQTPGYEYSARAAPNFPEALNYTDVSVGRFRGPASDVAEAGFQALIEDAELGGQRWFTNTQSRRPQGIYEGEVFITGFRRETRLQRERRCDTHRGLFSCETYVVVEQRCPKDIVDVSVAATLVDFASGRPVFTAERGAGAEREECFDIAVYPDTGQATGAVGETVNETFNLRDAPVGLVADAVAAAIPGFRFDIAPYMTTLRAEIVSKPLVPEEASDYRFEAAVKATRRGEIIGACAQWQELAAAYPSAPGILHNWGACTEARGDLAGAHTLYARSAEIARGIPLLRDRDARPIFDALARVSRGRYEDQLIDGARNPAGY